MIRKTRLLAGFMAAVLLSTTCLGGVSAAGEEGITTLNASATEDESTTWNATVTAGETLFPAGTELTFAVADEEKKAAVQEQLLAEIAEENAEEDTTAGKTLQDLHVYDFSLTDAQGAAVEYTDKVTYSVKSDSAADTDTDAADYVIYRVIENEDSEEGAAVTLEPIENSTGTVKLDESGWMTEFSVETEPAERIAVAVYMTAAAETEESSEEEDGIEEENAGDVGVSTFAVNVNEDEGYVETPEPVDIDSFAPMNQLLILDNIPEASVRVSAFGSGVKTYAEDPNPSDPYPHYQIKTISRSSETDNYEDDVTSGFSQGNFWGSSGHGPFNSMYGDMRAGDGDTAYGGVAVLFEGSSVENITDPAVYGETSAENAYQWQYTAGWKESDRDLDNTSMWIELEYTNAAYYNGELVNAKATIKLTPSKNRSTSADWNCTNGYQGTYEPMIQVSGSLYRGWVWQNVEQCHIDLRFYHKSDTEFKNPIKVNDTYEDLSYDSMFATYYTINSLNPAKDTYWQREIPERYTGAEYVLPTSPIHAAYIVNEYTVDNTQYTSNISTYFESNNSDGPFRQHAYNGGWNHWGGGQGNDDGNDHIGAVGWPQNSVMIIPEATNTLSFTLGQMEVQPWWNNNGRNSGSYTQASDMMWATISTQPFTQTRVPVNIDFEKKWADISSEDLNAIESVSLELRLAYDRIVDPGETDDTSDDTVIDPNPGEETLRSITLSEGDDGGWTGTFNLVPDLNFYTDNGYVNPGYVIREIKITYNDGREISADDSDFPFDISGDDEKIDEITRESEGSYNIQESFEITNTEKQTGTINIQKLSSDAEGDNAMPNVTFSLQKANVDEQNNWTPDPNSQAIEATTNASGQCSFTNLEEGYYLLTETKTQPGYTLLKEPVKITLPYVVSNGTASSITGNSQGIVRDDGTYYYNLTYTITNGQSFDLPQTGGTSADRIMRTGMILFATAAGALLYLNRKRRREQQKS